MSRVETENAVSHFSEQHCIDTQVNSTPTSTCAMCLVPVAASMAEHHTGMHTVGMPFIVGGGFVK